MTDLSNNTGNFPIQILVIQKFVQNKDD